MRSARSVAEQLHHLDHPRHAVLGEGARHDRLLRVRQGHVQAPGVGDLASMSSFVEKAVARYGMLARPSPRRTYSTKSVEFARRVSPVRWSRTFRPDEPGTKWTRSPPMSACGLPSRSYSQNEDGASRSPPRRPRAGRGPGARRVERQAVVDQPLAHLRPADLHPDLGQDALRLVDDPGDELGLEDVQGRPHQRSSAVSQRHRDGVRRSVTRLARRRDGPAWDSIASGVAPDAPGSHQARPGRDDPLLERGGEPSRSLRSWNVRRRSAARAWISSAGLQPSVQADSARRRLWRRSPGRHRRVRSHASAR